MASITPVSIVKGIGRNLKGLLGVKRGSPNISTSLQNMTSDLKKKMFREFLKFVFILTVAITLIFSGIGFIIMIVIISNSGAFVTPQSIGEFGIFDPGGGFADPTSCPIAGGVVSWGSYDPTNENNGPAGGHGSNAYWGTASQCRYSLPQSAGCCGPENSANICNNPGNWSGSCVSGSSRLCPEYGLAADIHAATGTQVILPLVNGQSANWTCRYAFVNPGGAGHTLYCDTTDGNVHLVFTHVNQASSYPTDAPSGTIVTTVDWADNPHLHLEAQVNGVWVRPENYFCGGN